MTDRLDPSTWLDAAKALPVGGRVRIAHDCGDGTTLIVDHKDNGWGAWCYRCNKDGWVPHPPESLGEKIARLKFSSVVDKALRADVKRPPLPKVVDPKDWPLIARSWLYRAGMSNEDIKEQGIYYHERSQRVVLPVLMAGRLVYWQARGFDPDRPKYLNPQTDKTSLVASFSGEKGTRTLALTEDILSAWKVAHRGGCDAWCLLGTNLTDATFARILDAGYDRVLVWLDPDPAGVRGTDKAIRKLRGYGVDARRINSDKDPKLLHGFELRAIVKED